MSSGICSACAFDSSIRQSPLKAVQGRGISCSDCSDLRTAHRAAATRWSLEFCPSTVTRSSRASFNSSGLQDMLGSLLMPCLLHVQKHLQQIPRVRVKQRGIRRQCNTRWAWRNACTVGRQQSCKKQSCIVPSGDNPHRRKTDCNKVRRGQVHRNCRETLQLQSLFSVQRKLPMKGKPVFYVGVSLAQVSGSFAML